MAEGEFRFTAEVSQLRQVLQSLHKDLEPIIRGFARMADPKVIAALKTQFIPVIQSLAKINAQHQLSKKATDQEKLAYAAIQGLLTKIQGTIFGIIQNKSLQKKEVLGILNVEKQTASELERKLTYARNNTIESNKMWTQLRESLNTLQAQVAQHGLLKGKLTEIEALRQKQNLLEKEITENVTAQTLASTQYQQVMYQTVMNEEKRRLINREIREGVQKELGISQSVYQIEERKLSKRIEQLNVKLQMVDKLREIQQLEQQIKTALTAQKSEEDILLEKLAKKEAQLAAQARHVNRIGDLKRKEIVIQDQIAKRAGLTNSRIMSAANKSKTFAQHLKQALGYVFSMETVMKRVSFVLTATLSYRSFYAVQNAIRVGTTEAIQLEQELQNINTLLEISAKSYLPRFRDEIRRMAVQFGESRESLTKGLYDIISASVEASEALNVLEVSVKAARAGLTEAKITADAITTILNAYNMEASRAIDVSDDLFTIVKYGKVTMAQLAPVIGNVATSAALLGIMFEDVGAGIATMTRQGINARKAVTALNRFFINMGKNYDMVSRIRREGLVAILPLLEQLTEKEKIQIAGGIRGYKALASAIQNMVLQGRDYNALLNNTGATQEAFEKNTNTTAFRISQMKEEAKDLARELGYALLPALEVLVGILSGLAGLLADNTEAITALVAATILWNIALKKVAVAQTGVILSASGKALTASSKGVMAYTLLWGRLSKTIDWAKTKVLTFMSAGGAHFLIIVAVIFAVIKGIQYLSNVTEISRKKELKLNLERQKSIRTLKVQAERQRELAQTFIELEEKQRDLAEAGKDTTIVNEQLKNAYENLKDIIPGVTESTENYTEAVELAKARTDELLVKLVKAAKMQKVLRLEQLELELSGIEHEFAKAGEGKEVPFKTPIDLSTFYNKEEYEKASKMQLDLLEKKHYGNEKEAKAAGKALDKIQFYLGVYKELYNLDIQRVEKQKELDELKEEEVEKEAEANFLREDFQKIISRLDATSQENEKERNRLKTEAEIKIKEILAVSEDQVEVETELNKELYEAYNLTGEKLVQETKYFEKVSELHKLEDRDNLRKKADLELLLGLYQDQLAEIEEANRVAMEGGKRPFQVMLDKEIKAKKEIAKIDKELIEGELLRLSLSADRAEVEYELAISPVVGVETTWAEDQEILKTATRERKIAYDHAKVQYEAGILSRKKYIEEMNKYVAFHKAVAKEEVKILKENLFNTRTAYTDDKKNKEENKKSVVKSYKELIHFYRITGQGLKAAREEYTLALFNLHAEEETDQLRKKAEGALDEAIKADLDKLRAALAKVKAAWIEAGKPLDENSGPFQAVLKAYDDIIGFIKEKGKEAGLELTEAYTILSKALFAYGKTVEEERGEKLLQNVRESIIYYKELTKGADDYNKQIASADKQYKDIISKLSAIKDLDQETIDAVKIEAEELKELRYSYAELLELKKDLSKIESDFFSKRESEEIYKLIRGINSLFKQGAESISAVFSRINFGVLSRALLGIRSASDFEAKRGAIKERFYATGATPAEVKEANEQLEKLRLEELENENQMIVDAAAYIVGQLQSIWESYFAWRQAKLEEWAEDKQEKIDDQAEHEHRSSLWLERKQNALDKRRRKKERDLAKAQQTLNIASAIMNTAVAVTKAWTAGPIIGPILAGLIAILGGIQIAMIKAQKFAFGGMFEGSGQVRGPGTKTSDSVNAKLSDGEFVSQSDAVRGNEAAYFAMNKQLAGGKSFSDFAVDWLMSQNKPVMPRTYGTVLATGGMFRSTASGTGYDFDRVERKLDLINENLNDLDIRIEVYAETLTDLDIYKKTRKGQQSARIYGS